MTSPRQIESSRRNALQNTPNTENGKQQSRRNVLRQGLTAETVLEPSRIRNTGPSKAAIVDEYLPQSPVEQELVRRLASHVATSPGDLDRDGMRMQGEILLGFRNSRQGTATQSGEALDYKPRRITSRAEFRRGLLVQLRFPDSQYSIPCSRCTFSLFLETK